MSVNVISLSRHQQQRTRGIGALLENFARARRSADDVYWLKENAEILNILECTGNKPNAQALETYADFYQSLPDRIAFSPNITGFSYQSRWILKRSAWRAITQNSFASL